MAAVSVRTTKSGEQRWRVIFRVDGRQRVVTFATEAHALRWKGLLESAGAELALAALAQPESAQVRTVTEQVEWHIAHLTGIEDGTRRKYRSLARDHITPALGHLPISVLDRAVGARWVNGLEEKGLSGKSIRNVHSLLSGAMGDAVRDQLVSDNPVKGQRLPVTVRKAEMTFLTPAEYSELLALAPPRWRLLIMVLAESGMRWGEATALTIADLDFDRRTIRIRRAWKSTHGHGHKVGVTKGRQSRTIAMPASTRAGLRELVRGRGPGEFVFVNARGGPVRHSSFHTHVWAPLVHDFAGDQQIAKSTTSRRAIWDDTGVGKRPRIHDLRHSFASWAIAGGHSLTSIQRHMGHQSIKTTSDTYGHIFRADLDAFAQVIPSRLAVAAADSPAALTGALDAG